MLRLFCSLAVLLCAWPLSAAGLRLSAASQMLDRLPLRFERNAGQVDARVRYYSRTPGYTLFLADREAVVLLPEGGALHMSLAGASRRQRVEPEEALPSRSAYFTGNDPSRWRRPVEHYGRVRYREVYRGIDLIYYGTGRQLEYDFVVAPGADLGAIRVKFSGEVSLNQEGDLVLKAGGAELRQPKPQVYQQAGGRRVAVEGRYQLRGDGEIGFAVGPYDRGQTLIIDPVLVYSSFVGGGLVDEAGALAVDRAGNLWVAGITTSVNFPTAGEPLKSAAAGSQDVFLAKIDPSKAGADSLVYATYFGGSGSETVRDITVDVLGNVYLTGFTDSTDFPLAGSGPQTENGGGQDIFVSKFETAGKTTPELVFSTYLGGNSFDIANAIAVDSSFRIYIAGYSASEKYPTAGSPPQTSGQAGWDAVISVLDPSKGASEALVFSTYYGGSSTDIATGIAVDGAGKIYVTGYTFSTNFPLSDKPYQSESNHGGDAFLVKLDPSKQGFDTIAYATYLGGSGYDVANRILLEPGGAIWLAGLTLSKDLPMAGDAPQTANAGEADAFVARMDLSLEPSKQLTYSSYLGGRGTEVAYGLARDAAGRVYVAGYTISPDFPVKASALQEKFGGGGADGFLAVLDPSAPAGEALVYATYLGGGGTDVIYRVAVDSAGDIAVAGLTQSRAFPVSDTPSQNVINGLSDGFVTKLKTCGDALAPAKSCN